MLIISGVMVQGWWHRYGCDIQPFYKCYMRHGPCLIGVYHPLDYHMITNNNPDILSCYHIGTKSFLHHGPHQLCSGPRMMTLTWIWHPIIPWLLYEARTTSDMLKSPSRQHHDHKLQTRHTQLLPWTLERWAWTMALINGIVFQGRGHRYGYAIALFCDCYMR